MNDSKVIMTLLEYDELVAKAYKQAFTVHKSSCDNRLIYVSKTADEVLQDLKWAVENAEKQYNDNNEYWSKKCAACEGKHKREEERRNIHYLHLMEKQDKELCEARNLLAELENLNLFQFILLKIKRRREA